VGGNQPRTFTPTSKAVIAQTATRGASSIAARAAPDNSPPPWASPSIAVGEDPTVSFDCAGDYTFSVTVDDGRGGSAGASITVTVQQTAAALEIAP